MDKEEITENTESLDSNLILRYIWTYPAAIFLTAVFADETTTQTSPLGITILVLAIGGIAGFFLNLIYRIIKRRRENNAKQ